MFRLYLAHSEMPQCPWLEATKVPTGRQFWQRLSTLLESLDDAEGRADMMFCFRGYRTFSSAQQSGSYDDEKSWHDLSNGLAELLRVVGYRLGTDNSMYNAMKHGLAAVSGGRGAEFRRTPDDAPVAARHGHSVTTLELDGETGRRSRVTRWVAVDATIGHVRGSGV
jgi:hypothetical protein